MFFLIFYCLASLAAVAPLNTLKQGQMINSSSTNLTSPNKLFTMGFFSPTNSKFSYLGIWYTDGGHPAAWDPVWVGNRDTPIYNNSGVLTIGSTGTLMITHNRGDPIELYSGQFSSNNNTTGTLLDSGNFVLYPTGNADKVLWQSFDYPTDTLIPGMKLGVNHRTNRSWQLTSWIGYNEPGSGAYTLEWDPTVRRLFVKRRGVVYWTSGALKGENFEYVPVPEPDIPAWNYRFKNVTSKDEEYFSYTDKVYPDITKDQINRSSLRLDDRGNINYNALKSSGSEWTVLAPVESCYGYNTNIKELRGCQLWEQPKCRNGYQNFTFQKGYFSNNVSNASLSYSDCRAKCWEDCDCLGFWNHDDTECLFWRGKNVEFKFDGHSLPLYLLQSYPPKPPTAKGKKKKIWIISVVLVSLVLIILSGLLYFRRRKIKQGEVQELIELLTMEEYSDTTELGDDENETHDLKVFSFSSIVAATENFLPSNKLGEGCFGPVYKGEFSEGRKVAVKRLKSGQGLLEFKNELILTAKLQHTNLVRLLGYCIHQNEKMLVYKYMPNKSLHFFLFDETKRMQLTWEKRFSIIEGIAQGLLYLHKYSRLRIVHRDLKADNILLDRNMNPKISAFGMARIFKQELSEANTNRIVGTYGYMAPEYAMEGIFSIKSDVYSFGVLMLEILSGRKNNSFYHVQGTLNLVAFAWELWNRDASLELMDPALEDSCIARQFLRCVHVGLLCVEDHALDRPAMPDVISMLTNENVVVPKPKKPAFYTGSSSIEEDSQNPKSKKISSNGLTISAVDAR